MMHVPLRPPAQLWITNSGVSSAAAAAATFSKSCNCNRKKKKEESNTEKSIKEVNEIMSCVCVIANWSFCQRKSTSQCKTSQVCNTKHWPRLEFSLISYSACCCCCFYSSCDKQQQLSVVHECHFESLSSVCNAMLSNAQVSCKMNIHRSYWQLLTYLLAAAFRCSLPGKFL